MGPRAGIAGIGLTRSTRRTAMRSAVGVAVVLGLSSECATIRRHDTLQTEQMLSAAGFHMKLADTPEKLAHLQTLTPRRLPSAGSRVTTTSCSFTLSRRRSTPGRGGSGGVSTA
jgi:hypothetical protein